MTLPLSHNFATLPIGGGNDMSTKGGIYSDQKCPVCGGMFRDFGKVEKSLPDLTAGEFNRGE